METEYRIPGQNKDNNTEFRMEDEDKKRLFGVNCLYSGF